MAAQKPLAQSHQWIVLICLVVQFALLIAAVVAVAVNRVMIEHGNTSATLPEGDTGVVIVYEIFWSIPLTITTVEMVLFILYRHYPPRLYLLSNILKYVFAVAGLILCVTRARHGIAIVIVVGLIIVLFLVPVIYGSIVYYRARNQDKPISTKNKQYDNGSTGIGQGGGVVEDRVGQKHQS